MRASLNRAIDARGALIDDAHLSEFRSAFRVCNGFYEGLPELALDVYGRTLVIHDYADAGNLEACQAAMSLVRERLPWINTVIRKARHDLGLRNGELLLGTEKTLCKQVVENGVRYAIRLRLNRDASLYLDTRNLRAWAKAKLGGARVLNTFAYTASLGVAAFAGGAKEVINTDRNAEFLAVGKDSYGLNGFTIEKRHFRAGDFFDVVAQLKKDKTLFDCVFLDAPFFSQTNKGRVDLEGDMAALINKVRPLVAHGGKLIAINNALFVSGKDYLAMLEAQCASGYLRIGERIPIALDFCGDAATRQREAPTDPAPFNHSTKIVVLEVSRKDGRTA